MTVRGFAEHILELERSDLFVELDSTNMIGNVLAEATFEMNLRRGDWYNNPEDYTKNGERKKWGRRYASITKAIPVPSSKSTQDYLKDSGGNLSARDAKGCQRFDSDRIERYSTRRGTGIPESGGGRGHRRAVSEHAWAGRTRFAWRFHDLYSNRNILF